MSDRYWGLKQGAACTRRIGEGDLVVFYLAGKMMTVVNGVYPYVYKTLLGFPENFGKNAGFYGALSLAFWRGGFRRL
jgi:hypothetical protein